MTEHDTACARIGAASTVIWNRIGPLQERGRLLETLGMAHAALRAHPGVTTIKLDEQDESEYLTTYGYTLSVGAPLSDITVDDEGYGDGDTYFHDGFDAYDVNQFAHSIPRWWLAEYAEIFVTVAAERGQTHLMFDVHKAIEHLTPELQPWLDPMPDPQDITAVNAWLDGLEADLQPKETP